MRRFTDLCNAGASVIARGAQAVTMLAQPQPSPQPAASTLCALGGMAVHCTSHSARQRWPKEPVWFLCFAESLCIPANMPMPDECQAYMLGLCTVTIGCIVLAILFVSIAVLPRFSAVASQNKAPGQ